VLTPQCCCAHTRPDRKIIDIVNNYKKISYDLGPTLLLLLEAKSRKRSGNYRGWKVEPLDRFSGTLPPLARPTTMILPLSNMRDRRTQVIWG